MSMHPAHLLTSAVQAVLATPSLPPPEDVVPEDITVVDVTRGGVVLVATVVLAVLVRIVMVRAIDRGDADRHTGRLVGRFLSVVVVVVGIIYAVDLAGVRVGPLLGALGIGGIALAFAAQDVLQNFVAGVLLQVRRPFRLGDEVGSGDYEGVVQDINLRTVVLTTYDGVTVYLPNAEVLSAPIVNYTRTPLNRTDITVGVAYDTDLEQAREVLLRASRTADGVVDTPGPEAWVNAFADSGIEIVVRYWHAADIASRWQVRSAVAIAVKQGLDAAGMTIPFPQRTLWFGPGSTTLDVQRHDGQAPSPDG